MKQREARQRSLKRQLNKLVLIVFVPMAAMILALLLMLMSVSSRYHNVLTNANTAAQFNKEFKSTLDLRMYNHVIEPRGEDSEQTLPMDELDAAVSVLRSLEKTTTLRDNRWRIRSMLNMCDNLRNYMLEIAHCERYDDRMELLERNIRGETGLTVLVETYMHEYIDDEVRELARLQERLGSQTVAVLIATAVFVALLSALMLHYSFSVARRITQPIGALARKASRFGEGDFSLAAVDTGCTELQTLNQGFDDMAGRINALIARQIQDQKELHRAELELLQAQINPHFLYNTLDSIAILAEMHRDEDVVTMVTSLSVFFRNSLSKGRDIITLQAEREQVTSYLMIQQVRYSDILSYEMAIPEELLGYMVPKLVLQPLVENALYHGIKYKRTPGVIRITGEDAGDDLILRVSDNGVGMDAERVRSLQAGLYEDRHTGLGLLNVHKRIRLYCGEPYGLSFESEPGVGTTVTVLLPKTIRLEREEGKA